MTNQNDFLGKVVSIDNLLDDSDIQDLGENDTNEKTGEEITLATELADLTVLNNEGLKPEGEEKPNPNGGSEKKDTVELGEEHKTTSNSYRETLDFLIDSKIIDPIEKFIVDDEGTEVPYEEAEITPETLSALITDKMEEVRQSVLEEQEKHVSDFTKHLIKIEKNGGDVQKALETYGRLVNPLNYINLENEEDQVRVIELDLKDKNISDSVIRATIKGFKSEGLLEAESKKSFDSLTEKAKLELDAQLNEAVERKNKDKEFLDTYKKNLKASLEKFSLPDNLIKPLVDAATKRDENLSFSVDKKYSELRRDPEKAAELIMFLMNKEAYLDMKMKEVKINDKLEVAKQIKIIKRTPSSHVSRVKSNQDNDLVPIGDL